MQSCMSVKNNCKFPVSVTADDKIFFSDIMPHSAVLCRKIDYGSRRIGIFDNRGRCIFDLWLSIAPERKNVLEINEDFCRII